jgi:hypothetical protein
MQPVQNLYLLEGWKLNQTNVAGLKLEAVEISLIETYTFLGFQKPRFSNYDTLRKISLRKFFFLESFLNYKLFNLYTST